MTAQRQIDLEKSTNVRFPNLVRFVMRTGARLAPGLTARTFARQFLTPFRAETPERERAWTAGAQRHTLRSGDYELAVYSKGLGGPQVLLVHGWSGRGSQLGAFIVPLLEAGYEVNWFDLPAHGESSGERSGLVHAVEAVHTVSRWLGGAHAVIAHSMGAAATTIAASEGADIGRMVYLSPPNDLGGFLYEVGRLIDMPRPVVARAQRAIEEEFRIRFDDLIPARRAPGLDQELLVFHDPADREIPFREVQALVDAWPKADLRIADGLGHRRILRDEGILREATEFVDGKRRIGRNQAA
jgi:pimeloyl-ACP methyl ester carboxylesterase